MPTTMPRHEWLAKRRELGIGASEAAAVLGLHKWLTPTKLWLDKTNKTELPDGDDEAEHLYWGHRLEPLIIERYCSLTRRTVMEPPEFLQNDAYPFAFVNMDGVVVVESDSTPAPGDSYGVFDAKNNAYGNEEDWEAGGPLMYQIQLQHGMMVSGNDWASLATLRFGSRFFWQDLSRDDKFIDYLAEQLHNFWFKCVQADIPPKDGSLLDAESLAKMFPLPDGQLHVALPPEAIELDEELQAHLQTKRELDLNISRLKQDMSKMLARQLPGDEAEGTEDKRGVIGALPNGSGSYSWKVQTRKPYVVEEESSYRVLRRHKK